ncbi:Crp/Fnr family transcriptional regulator [Allomesorhizobium alhagi]|uniref:Putative Crp/Fnr family transcriptional regulator n=1 Tax=Mesorhizobium alhagi CCNWXJ12-2 TaxID=1107882 RepID=H0I2Q6_9HYPH|nr:putative Crp/Fnr family transcriptional regulator [Mesorhizobium alhagi CCNWXJ12-2]
MPHSANSRYKNRLLGLLDPQDMSLLSPHLERVELGLRDRLEQRGMPIKFVYFIEEGIGSIVARMAHGRDTEVGLLGHEGMTGTVAVLGGDLAPHECFVQAAGAAMRIPIAPFRDAFEQSPTLQRFLLQFVQCLMMQTSYTALANARLRLEGRLARWLLMCEDRAGTELNITHEFLSIMLGVRRPGVTVAVQILEGNGLIRAMRGKIVIRDREGLIALADGSYGAPEAEYEKLLGSSPVRFKVVATSTAVSP